MKDKRPKSVDTLRKELLLEEGARTEYMEQRVVSQLGALIERVLEERQISQSELARIAGMHQPDLNALLRGRTEHIPTVPTMRRLAKALEIPLRISIAPTGAVSVSLEPDRAATSIV